MSASPKTPWLFLWREGSSILCARADAQIESGPTGAGFPATLQLFFSDAYEYLGKSLPDRRCACTLLYGGNSWSMAGFATYPALLPLLRSYVGLSNSEAGLVSGTFFAGYMAAVPCWSALRTGWTPVVSTCWPPGSPSPAASASLFSPGGSSPLWRFRHWRAPDLPVPTCRGCVYPDRSFFHGAKQSRGVAFYTSCFGLGTTGSLFLAGFMEAAGWHWAFAAAALGPLIAGPLVFFVFPPVPPHPTGQSPLPVLDFRPVLGNRSVMGYILGYAAHCWELFGLRSWMPAFSPSASDLAAGTGPLFGAAALAAWVNLLGPLASIFGNEVAVRRDRRGVVLVVMAASGALSFLVGFSACLPTLVVFLLMSVYFLLVMGDSAALSPQAWWRQPIRAPGGRHGPALLSRLRCRFCGASRLRGGSRPGRGRQRVDGVGIRFRQPRNMGFRGGNHFPLWRRAVKKKGPGGRRKRFRIPFGAFR